MNYFKNIPDNLLKLFIIILSLYTFFLSGVIFLKASLTDSLTLDDVFVDYSNPENHKNQGVIIWEVKPGGNADNAGLKSGDVILRINDDYISDANQYRNILNRYDTGDTLEYLVKRNNDNFITKIQIYKYFHFIFFIFSFLGFGFLFNSVVVGLSKPKDLTSFLFFLLGISACLGFNIFGGAVYYSGFGNFVFNNFWFGNLMFYPLILHFFLTFPVKYNFSKRKYIIPALYFFPAVLFILNFILFSFNTSNIIFTVTYLLGYVPFGYLGLGILFFLISYFRIKDEERKKPLKIILYGLILGLIGFIYYFFIFNPHISPRYGNILLRIPALLVLAIPASFSLSILKYKILNSGFSLKRNLMIVFSSLILILIFLIILNIINSRIAIIFGQEKRFVVFITIIVLIFIFDFINKSIRKAIDIKLLRNTEIQQKLFVEFTESLPYFKRADDIAERLINTVKNLFKIRTAKLYINRDEFPLLFNELKKFNFLFNLQGIINKDFFNKNSYYIISKKDELFFKFVSPPDTVKIFIFPLGNKTVLTGSLILFVSEYEMIFSDSEIELLETISYHAGAALENARLRQEELKKLKIDEELEIAKRIQKSLIPDMEIKNKFLDIHTFTSLSESISGDFFDIIKYNDEKLLLVLADTPGQSIPAALLMSKLQSMTRFAAKYFQSPGDILKELNKKIYKKSDEDITVTMLLALFDIPNKRVNIAVAGHNFPVLRQNNRLITIQTGGRAIGSSDEITFNLSIEEKSVPLTDDSLFVFYNCDTNLNCEDTGNSSMDKIIKEFLYKHYSEDIKILQQNLVNFVYTNVKDRNNIEYLTSVLIKVKNKDD